MRQRSFSALAGLSLLLCVSTIVFWIVCHGKPGFKPVPLRPTGGRYAIVLWDGSIAIARVEQRPSPVPTFRQHVYHPVTPPGRIPAWMLILIFLPLPALWLARRRPPIPPGHCKHCGYDLCATPNLCPECGAIPENMPTIST